jgi:Lar family restriction alleviation protein
MEAIKRPVKSCPFCGREASVGTIKYSPCEITELNNRESGYFVNCEHCGANNQQGLSYATEEEAIECWNRRVSALNHTCQTCGGSGFDLRKGFAGSKPCPDCQPEGELAKDLRRVAANLEDVTQFLLERAAARIEELEGACRYKEEDESCPECGGETTLIIKCDTNFMTPNHTPTNIPAYECKKCGFQYMSPLLGVIGEELIKAQEAALGEKTDES